MPLNIKIANKKGIVFDGQADFCEIPTAAGIEGVLPGHINFISDLVPGTIKYKTGGTASGIDAGGGGFIEISGDNVNILINS